ncbi:MAG TPA: WD40 repeat domain-containing protein, partial [Gemmataceae bacterium]|nr:WD40 repeat domain-containing protein [Gemmataceae bacterium]
KTIRVWDVQKGRQLHRFIGHSHPWVKVVLYLSDGKRALSGGNEGVVRLWTVDNAKEIRTFPAQKTPAKTGVPGGIAKTAVQGPIVMGMAKASPGSVGPTVVGGGVLSLAVSPDSKYFLAGSADKTLKLWEMETGKEVRQFPGHQNGVSAVAFSPDGKKALSGCAGQIQPNLSLGANSRTIRLLDLDTAKLIRSFNGHQGGIWGLAFSPDGKQFVSCGEDGTVRLWNGETAKEVRRFQGHTGPVLCVAFSPDGQFILSGGRDKSIRLWNAATGQELRRFEGHRDAVTSLVISRDGHSFLSGSNDRTARVWRLGGGNKSLIASKGSTPSLTQGAVRIEIKK